MNERLKELYQQAHMVREYPADDPMRGGNPPTVYWGGEESAKKFAELIVQECSKVCESYSAQILKFSQFGSNGAADCAKLIKEHFGLTNDQV